MAQTQLIGMGSGYGAGFKERHFWGLAHHGTGLAGPGPSLALAKKMAQTHP